MDLRPEPGPGPEPLPVPAPRSPLPAPGLSHSRGPGPAHDAQQVFPDGSPQLRVVHGEGLERLCGGGAEARPLDNPIPDSAL